MPEVWKELVYRPPAKWLLISHCWSSVGSQLNWSLTQLAFGEWQCTPWTGSQSLAGFWASTIAHIVSALYSINPGGLCTKMALGKTWFSEWKRLNIAVPCRVVPCGLRMSFSPINTTRCWSLTEVSLISPRAPPIQFNHVFTLIFQPKFIAWVRESKLNLQVLPTPPYFISLFIHLPTSVLSYPSSVAVAPEITLIHLFVYLASHPVVKNLPFLLHPFAVLSLLSFFWICLSIYSTPPPPSRPLFAV